MPLILRCLFLLCLVPSPGCQLINATKYSTESVGLHAFTLSIMYASSLAACHQRYTRLTEYVLVAGTSGSPLGHRASKSLFSFWIAQPRFGSPFWIPSNISHLILCLKLDTMPARIQLLIAASLIAVTATGTPPSDCFSVLHKRHAL